jgi:hypothetical protein
MEYYFPGKIPVIAWAWMNLGTSFVNVLKRRIKLIRQRKAAGKAVIGGGAGSLPTSQLPAAGKKTSDMVQPATGHIKAA